MANSRRAYFPIPDPKIFYKYPKADEFLEKRGKESEKKGKKEKQPEEGEKRKVLKQKSQNQKKKQP